ncbi:MAG: hypothetical protein U9R53_01445 [Chloroflexota bacterium]|nr:hypothetical protein [Chloroflexota bacterium]
MKQKTSPLDFLHSLNRYRFLTVLKAANECKEYQFSKQAVMLWLVNYPGDLYVQYHQALTYYQLGNEKQAMMQLEGLIEFDPEFIEPIQTLYAFTNSNDKRKQYEGLIAYLSEEEITSNNQDSWLNPLLQAKKAFSEGKLEKANTFIHQSIINNPPNPLPAILHLKTANKMKNQEMLINLIEIYYQQWPKCLQINVIKAIADLDQGKESTAVERLHWVAAHDSAGQVIIRLMGTEHRFQSLWPEQMEVFFDLPIPASVSSYLGWNQLQSGQNDIPEFKQTTMKSTTPDLDLNGSTQNISISRDTPHEENLINQSQIENDNSKRDQENFANEKDFEEIQMVFSKLAKRLKKPDLERADNRFPVYVIMTSKKRLDAAYGPNTTAIINDLLKKLVGYIQNLPDWGATLFYPDDPEKMSKSGLKPKVASDAWQVKLTLAELDQSLAKQGEMIGALLIIGGPEIIPFHHLPNPTQDNDHDVPSDNPYATIDKNYFIPQWPVGRLPGESGADPGLLLSQIRNLIYTYEKRSKQAKKGKFNISNLINCFLSLFSNFWWKPSKNNNLGYAAEIWEEASKGVFKSVGQTKDLQLSPPIHSGTLILNNSHGHSVGYFNLHGVNDGPNWYGQKDFASESNGPDYPIALSPTMFNEKSPSPKLVFTEACYGANIHDKHYEEALSLKFLDSGTLSFVGSTCIAYGSVTMPLISADYLADSFWKQVLNGQAAGYALMKAKLNLAEEMTRVQGFLDGEDQKTILSFVLFGDPLAVHKDLNITPKPLFRIKSHPAVRTISDSEMESTSDNTIIPKNINKQVKTTVEKYLPGLHNAQIYVNKSGKDIHGKSTKSSGSERYMVTLQKSFGHNNHTMHHHFARMTFDKKGKLIKFTTSR